MFTRIKQFQDEDKVTVAFPDSKEESNSILLFAGLHHTDNVDAKTLSLKKVEREILSCAQECGDLKEQIVVVEKKWHEAVLGAEGTTLNACVTISHSLIMIKIA